MSGHKSPRPRPRKLARRIPHRRIIGDHGPRGATSEEDGSGKNAARSETASSSRRPRHMTMALNDDGTRELATDDDGQGTRPGGDQRRHSAFIACNN
jgi:hypothetical protein